MTKTLKVTTRTAASAISNLTPFITSGALKGEFTTSRSAGQLGGLHLDAFDRAVNSGEPLYVVYSYYTPIGWHTPSGGWHVPNVKYSVTTTKHQSNLASTVSRSDWKN